jgi:2-polyprenyl-3-methyl-5-hydroxy-6-metoxy-1,4-benzoquinol methylase
MSDQAAQGWLSPFLRRRRIAAVLPHLRGKILDYGCGSGALAQHVPADRYVGVDVDEASLRVARDRCPGHRFFLEPPTGERFDTVVALAVIEHVPDPAGFLRDLAARLGPGAENSIVCTTPHPSLGWAHRAGARVGLFSREASEEHQALLGRKELQACGSACGLRLAQWRRFLLGANQVAVFRREAVE